MKVSETVVHLIRRPQNVYEIIRSAAMIQHTYLKFGIHAIGLGFATKNLKMYSVL